VRIVQWEGTQTRMLTMHVAMKDTEYLAHIQSRTVGLAKGISSLDEYTKIVKVRPLREV